jgi:hypothetical protein
MSQRDSAIMYSLARAEPYVRSGAEKQEWSVNHNGRFQAQFAKSNGRELKTQFSYTSLPTSQRWIVGSFLGPGFLFG